MKIVLGSDHGGVDYKSQLKDFLIESGYEVIDIGTNLKDPASWSEFGLKAAMCIKNKQADAGIVFCKSGEGVCIAANKVKGVYCGIAYNDETAIKCKTHDGCNMIAFGCEYMSIEDVKRRTILFLNSEFEGGRHLERLNFLKNFENSSN